MSKPLEIILVVNFLSISLNILLNSLNTNGSPLLTLHEHNLAFDVPL